MDDKAARIAARRQAILNARGDRLARLTSSARGEDLGGVYAQDIQAATMSSLKTFVGEESALPPPPPVNNTPSKPVAVTEVATSNTTKTPDGPKSNPVDVSARDRTPEWTPQQQEELLKALLTADTTFSTMPRLPNPESVAATSFSDQQSNSEGADNILSQLVSSLGGSADKFLGQAEIASPPQLTLGQRLIPILHLLSMIVLVVWFAVVKEPEQVRSNVANVGVKGVEVENQLGWERWARLMSVKPAGDLWSVPIMPSFFWAFTTIELVLHSLRLVSKPTPYRPPFLLELVLPHLPPPAPKIIITSLQYLQMGGMILNDLAVLIVGIGIVVLVSSWKAG